MRTAIPVDEVEGWFRGRLPGEWFEEVEVALDDEEILVLGRIPEPDDDGETSLSVREVACETTIRRFRKSTRADRMAIAAAGESTFGRTVSWGARCGPVRRLFTTNSVPVMTRLRLPERAVLDTLIDAGVARSRSEALAWCVRHVGETHGGWLEDLRAAFSEVVAVRGDGPM
jgi:hypothetical protein